MIIDRAKAKRVLAEAVEAADQLGPDPTWAAILTPALAAAEASNGTFIAAIGTGLLAKATEAKADPRALKVEGGGPGAHSARTLAQHVLAAEAVRPGIDIGVTGREPLNNQPFFRSVEISEEMVVRSNARGALGLMVQVLNHAAVSDQQDVFVGLRTYVALRKREARRVPAAGAGAVPANLLALSDKMERLMALGSEGGKKAQALVAGLLSAAFGPDSVVTSRVNDPDRHLAGDVGLTKGGAVWRLYEVRDKPMELHDVLFFAAKAIAAGCPRAVVVAVASDQKPLAGRDIAAWAAERGVVIAITTTWRSLATLCYMDADDSEEAYLHRAHQEVSARLLELEASEQAPATWASA